MWLLGSCLALGLTAQLFEAREEGKKIIDEVMQVTGARFLKLA